MLSVRFLLSSVRFLLSFDLLVAGLGMTLAQPNPSHASSPIWAVKSPASYKDALTAFTVRTAGTADWDAKSPAPGGNAKEVTTSVGWAGCTNATKVEVVLYKTVMGLYVEVGRKSTVISLATGTWATTITGLPSGTVITAADVRVTNAGGGILAATLKEGISVTVP